MVNDEEGHVSKVRKDTKGRQLRKGFAVTIAIYAYVLLYFNRFFNYTSFLFVLFAIYSYQKIEKPALVLYAINLFVSFAVKEYAIMTLGINALNCILFYTLAKYLFATRVQAVLLLTDDERIVLEELAGGKLQKEITDKIHIFRDRLHIKGIAAVPFQIVGEGLHLTIDGRLPICHGMSEIVQL